MVKKKQIKKGTKKPADTQDVAQDDPQFSSSIVPIVRGFAELKEDMCERHMKEIRNTPFKLLAMAFYNECFTKDGLPKKSNVDIDTVLSYYRPSGKFEFIKDTEECITIHDIAVIFGVPAVEVASIHSDTPEFTDNDYKIFFGKYFNGTRLIKSTVILKALKVAVKLQSHKGTREFVVLLCVFICCSLFFSNASGQILRSVIKDLYFNMHTTNWSEEIHAYLMQSLKERLKNGYKNCGGCTLGILYWFVEISNKFSPKEGDKEMIPRALKWNLDKIHEKLSDLKLPSLGVQDLVINSTLTLSDEETKIIEGRIKELEIVGTLYTDIYDNLDIEYGVDVESDAGSGDAGSGDEDLKEEIARLQAQLQSFNAGRGDVEAQMKDLKEENARLQAELQSSSSAAAAKFPELQTQMETLREENTRLQAELQYSSSAAAAKFPELQTQMETLREENSRIQARLQAFDDAAVDNLHNSHEDIIQLSTPDEEVMKCVEVTKTINLRVKSLENIDDVKDKLRELEDIEKHLQKVFFTEKNFVNDQKMDYERKDGYIVHMNLHLGVRMQVHVKVPWGTATTTTTKLISLDVHSWNTISDVKTKFQEKEGTPANQLTFIYDRKQLDDDLQTLAGYDIENDSIIHAVFLGEDKIKITVSTTRGGLVEVSVKLCSTVENLKRIIHCIIVCNGKFSVYLQKLTFNGLVLEDSKRLTDYKIQMGSLLKLTLNN